MGYKTSTISGVCSVVTDGSHYSPKSVDEGCYMVSVKDFTEYGFDFSGCRKISEQDYADLKKAGCVPEYGDILVGKDGARYFEDIIIASVHCRHGIDKYDKSCQRGAWGE